MHAEAPLYADARLLRHQAVSEQRQSVFQQRDQISLGELVLLARE